MFTSYAEDMRATSAARSRWSTPCYRVNLQYLLQTLYFCPNSTVFLASFVVQTNQDQLALIALTGALHPRVTPAAQMVPVHAWPSSGHFIVMTSLVHR